MDKSKQGDENAFNLSDLSDFQFGPAWARSGNKKPQYEKNAERVPAPTKRRDSRGPRRDDGRRSEYAGRPPRAGEGRGRDARRDGRDGRRDARGARPEPREQREQIQPTEGFRVELRPANNILEIISAEVHKQKRALPLLELARLVMKAQERYDLVLMKLEDGPDLIQSTRGDNATWLNKQEAVSSLWKSEWLQDLYREERVECEAPKGNFSSIAICSMGGEIIGPVNWHGYQSSLMRLYKEKYARMSLDAYRSKIRVESSEEAVAKWMDEATHQKVWVPRREGAEGVKLTQHKAVEEDFCEHHYDQVFKVVDKVFINGATPRKLLSPGLAAHLSQTAEKSRRFPQMIIPNLCHGLARHHMPIYKWKGSHYTGPCRVRMIPTDMVLADRMKAIVDWVKTNSGQRVEQMFAALSGVAMGEDEASRDAATEAHAPYAADMIWLIEQGFIVVMTDNSIWFPKGEAAPEAPVKKGKRTRKPKNDKATAQKPDPKNEAKPTPAPAASESEPAQEPAEQGQVEQEPTEPQAD